MGCCSLLFIILPALALAQRAPYTPPPPRPPYYRPSYNPFFDPYASGSSSGQLANECGSNTLICLDEEECTEDIDASGKFDGHLCPPFYVYDSVMKYCVSTVLTGKDNLDALEICESQGARLFYFQNSREFKRMGKSLKDGVATFMDTTSTYWLDAYYDDKREQWIRRTTGETIHWEQIFSDFGADPLAASRNIEVVRSPNTNRRCLSVVYDATHPELLKVTKEKCTDAGTIKTLCKLGLFDNNCQKRKDQVCCYTPTADYYIKNQQLGPGSAVSDSEANCFMEVIVGNDRTRVRRCDAVLKDLAAAAPTTGNTALKIPYRVGSSYFYFSTDACIGKNERKAVVSSRKVHEFISRYLSMANLVTADTYTSAIIGMVYRGGVHKMVWQNGKPSDYYNETFWNGDRPRFDDLGDTASTTKVCGVYKVSPLSFEYRWELSTTCTAAGKDINVCELPIRVTNLMPKSEKVECGMRHRRGVLARSAYGSGHELQALYGEFPWHAAIYRVRHHVGLVSTFSCSGALISKNFVVTAAHCVVGSSKAYKVVLGEYKVGGTASILEREVLGVDDILVYPGYETTNPIAHDIALLQLDREMDLDDYPQIGVACLPYPDILYRNTGAWDCFTVGWNGKGGALQKVESNILPSRLCQIHARPYYDFVQHDGTKTYGLGSGGYDKAHGHHLVTYQQHSYFNRRYPELVCTVPHESDTCVDDSAAVLVCRRAPVHTDDVFNSANRGFSYTGYQKPSAWIVNAYGKYRFDSDKWYVMGVSHTLSPCDKEAYNFYRQPPKQPKIQVFTPIHEYLSFIHAHQDAKLTN